MKTAYDFHKDEKNVLSKARMKYSDYEVSELSKGKHDDPSHHCYQFLKKFSNAAGVLMQCVANSSRPLRVCTNCVHHANKLNETHERLKKETNHKDGNKKCIDALTHKDVLEVVEDVFESAIGEKR